MFQLTDELFPFAVSLLRTFLMTTTSWVSSFRLFINNGQSMYSHGMYACFSAIEFSGRYFPDPDRLMLLRRVILISTTKRKFWRVAEKRYSSLYIATRSNKVYRRRLGEEVKCLVFIYYSMVLTDSNFRKQVNLEWARFWMLDFTHYDVLFFHRSQLSSIKLYTALQSRHVCMEPLLSSAKLRVRKSPFSRVKSGEQRIICRR